MEKFNDMSATRRRTLRRAERVLSPWVRLVERTVGVGGADAAVYHSFAQTDYVCIVGLTSEDELICVRQYRPAVDAVTLELPAGLLGAGEAPGECALRELAEEAGFCAESPPTALGSFYPDTGRLENRLWAFAARGLMPLVNFVPEPDVARVLIPITEVPQLIADGQFNHAMHIAALGLAVLCGVVPAFGPVPWPSATVNP